MKYHPNRKQSANAVRERKPAALIIATGPEASTDKDGQPTLVWQVWASDADRNPVSRVYKCYDYWKTALLAVTMADDRKVRLVEEYKEDPNPDPERLARHKYLLGLLADGTDRRAS